MKYWSYTLLFVAFLGFEANATCVDCHAGQAATLESTPHIALQSDTDSAGSCIACHGTGSEHMTNPFAGGVLAFAAESAQEKSAACGSCHTESHNANRSVHARAGIACTDCHAVHSPADAAAALPGFENLEPGSADCAGCHEDVLVQFAFNKRHRLQENSITCVACHDPHAAPERLQLGAFKRNVCASCHAGKDGPFVFEHAASRVDGCIACHTPHGSPNRHLLAHQDVGAQCYSCHAEVAQFHLGFAPVGAPRFGVDTVCTNCHVSIHGSNFDRLFLK